jgi:hypothetical protein
LPSFGKLDCVIFVVLFVLNLGIFVVFYIPVFYSMLPNFSNFVCGPCNGIHSKITFLIRFSFAFQDKFGVKTRTCYILEFLSVVSTHNIFLRRCFAVTHLEPTILSRTLVLCEFIIFISIKQCAIVIHSYHTTERGYTRFLPVCPLWTEKRKKDSHKILKF